MEDKKAGDPLTPEEARAQSQKYRQDMAALLADAELGRRVREMLAREKPPPGAYDSSLPLWDWLRWELLGGIRPQIIEPTSLTNDGTTAKMVSFPPDPSLVQALRESLKIQMQLGNEDLDRATGTPEDAHERGEHEGREVRGCWDCAHDAEGEAYGRQPTQNDPGTPGAVEAWNAANPPGTRVIVTDDFGNLIATKTRSAAWMLGADGSSGGHTAVVLLEDRSGAYLLSRCKPLISKEEA